MVEVVRARMSRGDESRDSPRSQPAEATRRLAVLSHLAVDRHHRGLGAGSRLMDLFERAAGHAGADELCLATTVDSDASRIYERRGWVEQRRRTMFDGRTIGLYSITPDAHVCGRCAS